MILEEKMRGNVYNKIDKENWFLRPKDVKRTSLLDVNELVLYDPELITCDVSVKEIDIRKEFGRNN